MIHANEKFAPLDFINKKVKGKRRSFTQTKHPLFSTSSRNFYHLFVFWVAKLKLRDELFLFSKPNAAANSVPTPNSKTEADSDKSAESDLLVEGRESQRGAPSVTNWDRAA